MVIYFILYFLIFISGYLGRNVTISFGVNPKPQLKTSELAAKQNKKISLAIFLFVFLLLALRHPSMGIDLGYNNTIGYLSYFTRIADTSWSEILGGARFVHYEEGYILLNKIISVFSKDWQFFLGAVALLSLWPISKTIIKENNDPLMSWIVFLGLPTFLMLFSGLRQALAMGICFLAVPCIKEKKFWRFVIYVAVASFFHRSAFVFLLAYPVYFIKMTKTVRYVSLVVLGIVFIFKNPLFSVINKILGLSMSIDNNGAWVLFAALTAIYVYGSIVSKGGSEVEGLLNIFYIACFWQAFGGLNYIISRVGYYFILSLVLLLPKIVSKINDPKNRLFNKIVIYICFIAYGLFSLYTSTWAQANPYIFFWG